MTDIIQFDERGLVPVVVQDAISGDVLMLAYMNAQALEWTQSTGRAHYWSRSRNVLWRKGATSGNEQIVEEIRINCEENSLLLVVTQTGAVCHTGYPTCFYRRIEPDGALTIVRTQRFDPAAVYGHTDHAGQIERTEIDELAEATREQFAAYAFLRDNDLTAESGTSARLRNRDEEIEHRLADELRELAGVLEGSHHHLGGEEDVILEASQVVYWAFLVALRANATWSRLRPDLALATSVAELAAPTIAAMLRHDARTWESRATLRADRISKAHATLALVGQACRNCGIDPIAIINRDLAALRARPYLQQFFRHRRG
ncbi:MAG: phosphoribosyl-AMP cyclohydrolase [Thermomicrobiales bacterium]